MSLWERIVRPAAFRLDSERAHEMGIKALELGLAAPFYNDRSFDLGPIERFGMDFPNPLGVAAGFDKNGVVVDQLASLGFGFVEVGTVTLEPQPGNPKPRLFRLPKDKALINRLGFNNDGAAAVAERLSKIERRCPVGVNIGKNKDVPNEEATENYLRCFEIVHPVADYVVVNVSSPNTASLRELQQGDILDELLKTLQERNRVRSPAFRRPPAPGKEPPEGGTPSAGKPLLVKIAPDLSEGEIQMIVDVCLRHGIDGIIATNTTVSRDGLLTADVESFGAGGLSGKPLTRRSTEVITQIYRYSNGKPPIVGVGGIFSAEDAFEKIAAGASLIQAYTGFVYGGPSFASDVNYGLAAILKDRGFSSLDDAMGSAAAA